MAERDTTLGAAVIASALGGRRTGKGWSARCPAHDDKKPSLSIGDAGGGRVLIHCHAGCDQRTVIAALQTKGLWKAGEFAGAGKFTQAPKTSRRRDDLATPTGTNIWQNLWREGWRAAGSPAAAYLASRGLTLPPDAPLRFHPACPRGQERLPAMLALMTDPVTGTPCGLHRTFLRPGGGAKAEVTPAKMMLGLAGVMRLSPDDQVTSGLGIAEGIETALAIMQHAGWRPVWAAGSSTGITKFPVLPGIEALTMFPDLDDKGAGIKAAHACASRWYATGREVTIRQPPAGTDWHDALVRAA